MTDTDIHLLLTGDELMSGDTIDSNSAMIAQALAVQGQTIAEKITLGDDRERLVAGAQADNRQRRRYGHERRAGAHTR
jgi:nicotinamide-nucleotide amidase